MAEITGDVRKTGMKGVIGARWLLGTQRRTGKAASSVVGRTVSFHVQDGQLQMKIRGRRHPVGVYDFDRGRSRPEVSDW